MRILLIQIRPDSAVAEHEFGLIVVKSDVQADAFVRVNVALAGELNRLDALDLRSFDAVMIGGSGDYLISRGDVPEVVDRLCQLIVQVREKKIPLLGICFGGQLMTHALGGRVAYDDTRAEVGTFAVTRSSEGARDPIFSELPQEFLVQQGHKDHCIELPPGAVRLASSERSANQAFMFPGEPLYALQFHPELDEDAVKFRVDYYAVEYKFTPEKIEAMHKGLRPSPDASRVIRLFLDKIVAQEKSGVS
jgi:GMP synthase (glutamine-hydrolysing)